MVLFGGIRNLVRQAVKVLVIVADVIANVVGGDVRRSRVLNSKETGEHCERVFLMTLAVVIETMDVSSGNVSIVATIKADNVQET